MSVYKGQSFQEWKKEVYELEHINYNGTRMHVEQLHDKSVTDQEYGKMWMNSYARERIARKLDDNALILMAESYLRNCSNSNYPCSTYDEAVISLILPEFIRRMKEDKEVN